MSWREILGLNSSSETLSTHNSHNTKKPTGTVIKDNCADIANSAYRDLDNENFGLLTVLADICHGLPITPFKVKEALSPEDIDDWRKGTISRDTLTTFTLSLVQRQEMSHGKYMEMK